MQDKTIANKSVFHEAYMDVVSAVEKLNAVRLLLGNYDYLTDKDNRTILNTAHIMYRKLVKLGDDIIAFNDFEKSQTIDIEDLVEN